VKSGNQNSEQRGEVYDDRLPVLFFDPTTVLYVSLFLILFAFFAALNTRADQQPKVTSDVMASLGQSFGGGSALVLQDARLESSADAGEAGSVLGEAERLVEEVFPGSEFSRTSQRLDIVLMLDGVFLDRQVKLAPSRELFIKRLVEQMVASEKPSLLEIGLSRQALNSPQVLRRAALLAQVAQKYGLPADDIQIATTSFSRSELRLGVEVRS